MAARAQRFQPQPVEITADTRDAALETIEQRIRRTLDGHESSGETADCYIRPLCLGATLSVSVLTRGQMPIQVPCPEDELRRAQIPFSLRGGGANQVALYPLSEEVYSAFATQMEVLGHGFGDYVLYKRDRANGWQEEEFT